MGASNHVGEDRQEVDFYSTQPKAIEVLFRDLPEVIPNKNLPIWEMACGKGDLSNKLLELGYDVKSTDLYDYGFGESGVDFLNINSEYNGNLLTNPPYNLSLEFAKKSMELLKPGNFLYLYLKVLWLESNKRKEFFKSYPPKYVCIMSSRIACYKDGIPIKGEGAVAYAWYIWEKGFMGDPILKFIN